MSPFSLVSSVLTGSALSIRYTDGGFPTVLPFDRRLDSSKPTVHEGLKMTTRRARRSSRTWSTRSGSTLNYAGGLAPRSDATCTNVQMDVPFHRQLHSVEGNVEAYTKVLRAHVTEQHNMPAEVTLLWVK